MISKICHFCKVWGLAVRPWAYSSSVLTVCLGAAIANTQGHALHWANFFVTLLGVICFHTAANLLNDCYDFKRGLDQEVNPGSGAVVRGLISAKAAFIAAMGFLTAGLTAGFYLFWVAGWVVMLLGVIGTLIAITYTTAGACLKYNGLGDLAIFLAFGILPVFGTYWVQTQQFSWLPFIWSIPPALLTVGILHANNWRDIGRDIEKNCQTLAVRIGESWSARYYRALICLPFLITLTLIVIGKLAPDRYAAPIGALLVILAAPYAWKLQGPAPIQRTQPDIALDASTAQLHMIFVLLLTIGFVVG